MNNLSIQNVIASILKKYTVNVCFAISFAQENYQIFTNSSKISQNLLSYYDSFVPVIKNTDKIQKTIYIIDTTNMSIEDYQFEFVDKIPEAGKNKIKEAYVDLQDGRIVHKKETGMLFFSSSTVALISGESLKNLGQVVNFVNNWYIEYYLNNGYILGHASAILWKNKGMAIAGFSGMGKSTLSLHLMNENATFISNDRILLKKNYNQIHMVGVPKYPRVNPGTIINNPSLQHMLPEDKIKWLQSLSPEELWDLEDKYDVFIEKIFGPNRICLSASLDILVVLNWKQSTKTEINIRDIHSRKDLIHAVMKKKSIFHHATKNYHDEKLDIFPYLNVLNNCILVEINGVVDFAKATKFCMDYLENK